MRAEQRSGSLLAAPYAVFLLLFAAYPIVFALVLVFLQWDLVTAPSFAGFDNVRLLANDGRFWRAVGNTFVFLSIHVPLQIVSALALALALNRQTGAAQFLAGCVLPPRRDLRRRGRHPLE
jgi:multiple sugar transport system permease protein